MNPVIVVEGRDDTRRLREIYPDIETIETNGSAIDEETIALIQKALQTREVIVFTDPDYPGTRIRNIIQERVPGVKHAFIEREEAVRKDNHKSLGVEHASTASIQRALESVHEISTEPGEPVISQSTLMALGFIGRSDSATRRQKVADFLKIGHTNGKQFAKRLQLFGITEEQLRAALEAVLENEDKYE